MILAVSATMPYIYPELPDYITLSLFSLATLPYSLKFITGKYLLNQLLSFKDIQIYHMVKKKHGL